MNPVNDKDQPVSNTASTNVGHGNAIIGNTIGNNADFCKYDFVWFSHLPFCHSSALTFCGFPASFKNATVNFLLSAQTTNVDDVKDPLHGIPSRNYGFVGRTDILEQMKHEIAQNISSEGCRPLVLSGVGGM